MDLESLKATIYRRRFGNSQARETLLAALLKADLAKDGGIDLRSSSEDCWLEFSIMVSKPGEKEALALVRSSCSEIEDPFQLEHSPWTRITFEDGQRLEIHENGTVELIVPDGVLPGRHEIFVSHPDMALPV